MTITPDGADVEALDDALALAWPRWWRCGSRRRRGGRRRWDRVQPGEGCTATPTGLSITTIGVVVVDDPDALDDLGHDLERVGLRRDRHVEHRAGVDAVALADAAAVDLHESLGDQVGGPGAGEAEHPRHRGVDALAGQAVGHEDGALLGVRWSRLLATRTARHGCRRARMPRKVWRMIRPAATLMQMSAMLKTGQLGSIRKSTTWPRRAPGRADEPVGEVAADAGEQEAEGQRPQQAAEPAAQPEHDDHGRRWPGP